MSKRSTCGIETEHPLRVNTKVNESLLSHPEFTNVPTDELIYRAEVRLGLARLGSIKGLKVTDRVMAIAVLVGMPDKTEFGL